MVSGEPAFAGLSDILPLHARERGAKAAIVVPAGGTVTYAELADRSLRFAAFLKGRGVPEWLSFDSSSITGRIVSMPTREQINLPVQEQLIVELYSK